MSKRLIRIKEVENYTGHSRSEINRGVKEGWFPKPVPLGRRTLAWVEEEIGKYVEAKIASRDSAA